MQVSINQPIEEELAAGLATGALPPDLAQKVRGTLDLLTAPLRITVMGLPSSGKTKVLELLAGEALFPDDLYLGTVRLRHGEWLATTVTVADGGTLTLEGRPDPDVIAMVTPVMTEIAAPLPALSKISLMMLPEVDDPSARAKAIRWAAKQTDIAIWCTHAFGSDEKDIWSHIPDNLRQRGVVLQTDCDDRDAATAELQKAVDGQFAVAIAIQLDQAIAAGRPPEIDNEGLKKSGGRELVSLLLKEIDARREAAVERAQELLIEVGGAIASQERTSEPLEAVAASGSAATEPVPVPPTELLNEASEDAIPAHAQDDPTNNLPDDADLPPGLTSAFRDAADRLRAVGESLMDDGADQRTVLGQSASTLTWLDTHLNAVDEADHPRLIRFRKMTEDATDLVQLLQMEGDDKACIDAAAVLLQLKRGFLAAAAA